MERLRKRADFVAAAGGIKVPVATFVLQARDRDDQGPVRVGFTVSRKVGNAVERNRVRRRLREVVRLKSGDALRRGHDYVLIGRRAALSAQFAELTADYQRAIARLGNAKSANPKGRAAHGGRSDQPKKPATSRT